MSRANDFKEMYDKIKAAKGAVDSYLSAHCVALDGDVVEGLVRVSDHLQRAKMEMVVGVMQYSEECETEAE